MTGNRKEHLWKEKIMKIRKTICSLLLVCLAFLGIFVAEQMYMQIRNRHCRQR